jgi:lycopene beta-cyclase
MRNNSGVEGESLTLHTEKIVTENYMLQSKKIYDLAIIGAGGAGMCLLHALFRTGYLEHHSILIIEPESKTTNDRTWCFWAQEEERVVQEFQSLCSNVWHHAHVEGIQKPLAPYSYYHMRSHDLYAFVRSEVEQLSNVAWYVGYADIIKESHGHVAISINTKNRTNTDTDALFRAGIVFDSRITPSLSMTQKASPPHEMHNPMLWQSFYGVRLRGFALSHDEARLMDFSVEQNGFTQFMYVLPTSNDEALIELTRFGTEILTEDYARPLVMEWIKQHKAISTDIADIEIVEIEQAHLLMSVMFNQPKPIYPLGATIIPIGTAAGAMKSTTGYAFKTMVSHSFALAEALTTDKHRDGQLPTPYHKQRFHFYDVLLIHILTKRAYEGRRIFQQLFRRVPIAHVFRFLDEKSSLLQDIPLLFSLPIIPFLRALWDVTLTHIRMARQSRSS